MIQISVVDRGSEERLKVLHWLQGHFESDVDGAEYFPKVMLSPVSVSELKFNRAPDVLVIGSSLARENLTEIAHIRRLVPSVPILVIAPEKSLPIASVEYLARLGIDQLLSANASTGEILRSFVMACAQVRSKKKGRFIAVDGAKGGCGATTIAAGFAELLAHHGKRTVLIDVDSERQSLSRFLNARPFVNQPLEALLKGQRAVANDHVEQCAVPIWSDRRELRCMTPIGSDLLYGTLSAQLVRTVISIFEVLDQCFDYVIVDSTAATGTLRRIIHRASDRVIFVADGDPASVYASVDKIKRIREECAQEANVTVLGNCRFPTAQSVFRAMRHEFQQLGALTGDHWSARTVPFCRHTACWPGSGLAPFSLGSRKMRTALSRIAQDFAWIPKRASRRDSARLYLAGVWRGVCGALTTQVNRFFPVLSFDLSMRREFPRVRPQITWSRIAPSENTESAAPGL